MQSIRKPLVVAFAAAMLAGCTQKSPESVQVPIDQVAADLKTVATARVFFGHQSVGRNLLAGVQALATEAGVPLRIEEVKAGESPEGPGLFHSNIGENGAPDGKIAQFAASVAGSAGPAYDVAVLKLCYVDLDEGSNEQSPVALFKRYEESVKSLSEQRPQTALIHATMPLTSDPPGWKTTLKRWLGKSTWTDDANRRRAEYNQQLRQRFVAGDTFDIARIEATRPDGSVSSFTFGGDEIETMYGGYTHDGGHLTEAARRHMAAAFLHTLADSVRRHSSSTQSQPAPAQP